MKKIGLILGLFGLVLVSGCDKTEDYQALMKKYGTDYYNTYMSNVKGLDIAEVTLGMMRDLNKKGLEKYDLSDLEKCKDETVVKMTLTEDNKIKKYEYELKCQK